MLNNGCTIYIKLNKLIVIINTQEEEQQVQRVVVKLLHL